MHLVIHTDGGARGNPGPAASGFVIETCICQDTLHKPKSRSLVFQKGERIGVTTNNVAEYMGIIHMWTWLTQNTKMYESKEIYIFLDSLLVVQQLNGVFKVKDSKLRELLFQIKILEQPYLSNVLYTHIPRAQNAVADAMVNKALDNV